MQRSRRILFALETSEARWPEQELSLVVAQKMRRAIRRRSTERGLVQSSQELLCRWYRSCTAPTIDWQTHRQRHLPITTANDWSRLTAPAEPSPGPNKKPWLHKSRLHRVLRASRPIR